ncbi:MAG: cell division protein FtsQ/DivIB [Sphingomonadales bacterium]|nr:cell division protein FtsQ/DivIB [Sphingomonadales bacterium]
MRPLSAEPRYLPQGGAAHPAQAGQRRVAVAPRPLRRDPAPSRLAFRLQRLWLTPFVRSITRIGLPVFALVLGLGLWLGDDGRRAELVARYDDVKTAIQNRPEFMVSLLKIEGAGPEVDGAIRAMLPVELPASSFDIDLEAYRTMIRRLDAVADASLVIRSGGLLEVRVTERTPAILWRTPLGLEMLDAEGHRVATLIDRASRPDLPLIAGEGANAAVPEALAVLRAAQPILSRARGLVRVGERRWDLVLDRDQRILLPAADPVRAVERLIALDAAEDLLDRDFTHLDLRNQTRPTIRLSANALEQFRAITGQATKVKATP